MQGQNGSVQRRPNSQWVSSRRVRAAVRPGAFATVFRLTVLVGRIQSRK